MENSTLDSRAEVIQTFRDRIRHGDHVRLTTDDFAVLIEGFVEGLHGAKIQEKIRVLCEAEIKLLEEGYSQASVAKYLGRYRRAIKAAIEDGLLLMTRTTSHRYVHQQRVTGKQEERHEHWALTYLKYSNEVYESLDKRQQFIQNNEMSATAETDEVPIPADLVLPLEAAAVTEDKAIEAVDRRDGDDRVSTEVIQQLKDDWQAEMDEQMGRLRAEFLTQLQGAKQEKSVGWFVKRIEALEEQNLKLRLEQDKAIATGASLGQDDADEVDRLKVENQALALELGTVRDKLDAFRRLLNGDADQNVGIAGDAKGEGAIAQHPVDDQGSMVSSQPTDAGVMPRRAGPKPGKAFQRAENIFLAVKDWNRIHPTEAFAINAGMLENVFRIHRQAVKAFFEAYQNEIEVYHQELGVDSPRWFNRGKDTEKLKAFVERWGKGELL
jgi:Telomere resolvase